MTDTAVLTDTTDSTDTPADVRAADTAVVLEFCSCLSNAVASRRISGALEPEKWFGRRGIGTVPRVVGLGFVKWCMTLLVAALLG